MNVRLLFTVVLFAASACGARTPPSDETVQDEVVEGGSGAGGEGGGTSEGGATGEGGEGPLSVPTMLFVEGDGACGVSVPVDEAETALRPVEAGDTVAVVELVFADECTGAGGQHILLRTLDQSRELWLGAHACYFFDFALVDGAFRFGVVRSSQTAARFPPEVGQQQFHTTPAACIGWPGEPEGLTSDSIVRAVGVFASLEEATSFAEQIE